MGTGIPGVFGRPAAEAASRIILHNQVPMHKRQGVFISLLVLTLLAVSNSGCASAPKTIVYQSTQYGFSFTLPGTWKGYTVEVANWQGFNAGPGGDALTQSGPLILIRHPNWTADNPRQDIPIMVFTPSQWSDVTQGLVLVSAAPVPPTELGRNANYVFALPPRYDYAELPGWQEVEAIIASKPLTRP